MLKHIVTSTIPGQSFMRLPIINHDSWTTAGWNIQLWFPWCFCFRSDIRYVSLGSPKVQLQVTICVDHLLRWWVGSAGTSQSSWPRRWKWHASVLSWTKSTCRIQNLKPSLLHEKIYRTTSFRDLNVESIQVDCKCNVQGSYAKLPSGASSHERLVAILFVAWHPRALRMPTCATGPWSQHKDNMIRYTIIY